MCNFQAGMFAAVTRITSLILCHKIGHTSDSDAPFASVLERR